MAELTGDVIVYWLVGGRDYLARFDELGWVQWPAVQGGWAKRKSGKESEADASRELSPNLGALALRLSEAMP